MLTWNIQTHDHYDEVKTEGDSHPVQPENSVNRTEWHIFILLKNYRICVFVMCVVLCILGEGIEAVSYEIILIFIKFSQWVPPKPSFSFYKRSSEIKRGTKLILILSYFCKTVFYTCFAISWGIWINLKQTIKKRSYVDCKCKDP